MITKFRFKGHDLTLGEVGMMKIMGEQAGNDPIDPLKGIDDTIRQAAYIFHAGLAFEDVTNKRPVRYSFKEASEIVDTFSLAEVLQIVKTYNKVLVMAVEEGAQDEGAPTERTDTQEKKS